MQFRAREENCIACSIRMYGGDVDKKRGVKNRDLPRIILCAELQSSKKNRLYKDGTIVIEDQLQL